MGATRALYAAPECEEWEAAFEREAREEYLRTMGYDRPVEERLADARKNAHKAPRLRRDPR